uniref:EF-hand domain-containing protein n=1 Tax=Eutreptiella gymnastica TaxID=73025 RepID=A0A7S1I157_9EUGL|mmetsp:Transcript_120060/g.208984  ORF Transcript_120060/g.208984 Transcript_120060/m.208984 type:complete len:747 (+) Transcript_120060:78-2318(+)
MTNLGHGKGSVDIVVHNTAESEYRNFLASIGQGLTTNDEHRPKNVEDTMHPRSDIERAIQRLFSRCDVDGDACITADEFDELDITVRRSKAYKKNPCLSQNTHKWNEQLLLCRRNPGRVITRQLFQDVVLSLLQGLPPTEWMQAIESFHTEWDLERDRQNAGAYAILKTVFKGELPSAAPGVRVEHRKAKGSAPQAMPGHLPPQPRSQAVQGSRGRLTVELLWVEGTELSMCIRHPRGTFNEDARSVTNRGGAQVSTITIRWDEDPPPGLHILQVTSKGSAYNRIPYKAVVQLGADIHVFDGMHASAPATHDVVQFHIAPNEALLMVGPAEEGRSRDSPAWQQSNRTSSSPRALSATAHSTFPAALTSPSSIQHRRHSFEHATDAVASCPGYALRQGRRMPTYVPNEHATLGGWVPPKPPPSPKDQPNAAFLTPFQGSGPRRPVPRSGPMYAVPADGCPCGLLRHHCIHMAPSLPGVRERMAQPQLDRPVSPVLTTDAQPAHGALSQQSPCRPRGLAIRANVDPLQISIDARTADRKPAAPAPVPRHSFHTAPTPTPLSTRPRAHTTGQAKRDGTPNPSPSPLGVCPPTPAGVCPVAGSPSPKRPARTTVEGKAHPTERPWSQASSTATRTTNPRTQPHKDPASPRDMRSEDLVMSPRGGRCSNMTDRATETDCCRFHGSRPSTVAHTPSYRSTPGPLDLEEQEAEDRYLRCISRRQASEDRMWHQQQVGRLGFFSQAGAQFVPAS